MRNEDLPNIYYTSTTYNLGHKGWKKKLFYTHFAPPHPYAMLTKHFDLTQVCILPFSNLERGNGGVDTYSVDIMHQSK